MVTQLDQQFLGTQKSHHYKHKGQLSDANMS